MSGTIFRLSAGFLTGVLTLLALALFLANHYATEQQRLAAAGDTRGAQEASQRAVRLDPFDTEALLAQSLALQQQRKYEKAEAALREAIERDPNNYFPHLYMGSLQVARGNPGAAAESYRDVLRLNPKASLASVYLAQTLVRQGKLEEAKQEYLKLKRERRISFEGQYDLGRIEVRTGEAEKGFSDIKRARRRAENEGEELTGVARQQRERLISSMDLAMADALVVAGRYGRARRILSSSSSEQAPGLLELLGSDPEVYREQVVNSEIY